MSAFTIVDGTVALLDPVTGKIAAVLDDSGVYRLRTETKLASGHGLALDATVAGLNPLTDAQLRATAVPVSGTFWQATQPVSAASLPLPTGAATEATLAARLTEAAFQARINTLGQKTMANGTPVTIASDQSVIPVSDNGGSLTVDASSWPLPTGAATEATLALIKAKTDNLDAALSTRATESTLATMLTLAGFQARINTLGQKTMANGTPVTLASDQSAIPVTDNGGNLSVDDGGGSLTVDGAVTANQGTPAAATAPWAIRQSDGSAFINPALEHVTAASPHATRLTDGTAFYDATKTGQLPSALVGGRLDTNNGAWLGSTAPTVGQKTMANAIPVVLASDQSALPVAGATDEKTFTVVAKAVALGNRKSLLSVYNPTGATKKIKLREFYVRNSQTTAVTGVAAAFQIHRWAHTSAPTGGTVLTARAHDTTDTLTESVVCHTGATLGGTEEAEALDIMRISTDEWGPGTADVESNQQAFANYLPARALSSTVLKPFTANPGQGLHMKMATNTSVSTVDIIFVFTQA